MIMWPARFADEGLDRPVYSAGCPRSLAFGDLGDHEPHGAQAPSAAPQVLAENYAPPAQNHSMNIDLRSGSLLTNDPSVRHVTGPYRPTPHPPPCGKRFLGPFIACNLH